MLDEAALNLTSLTSHIVSAYVSNNQIGADELAKLIEGTHEALSHAGAPPTPVEPEALKPDKAAVRKSVTPEHLTSFIDGRPYKSLRRHLTVQGHTPESYRERYSLPKDYPVVASSYSA